MSMNKRKYEAAKRRLEKRIRVLEGRIKALTEEMRSLYRANPLACDKCGMRLAIGDVFYKEYESRRTETQYVGVGEYMIRQVVERNFLCVCPMCGTLIEPLVRARPDVYLRATEWHFREEETPEFQPGFCRAVGEAPRPLGEFELDFVRKELGLA